MTDDHGIRFLLDTSAIIAFTRGSMDVGEPMSEVLAEPDATVGLPLLCLSEAYRTVTNTDLVDLLVAHEVTTIIAPEPHQWRKIAGFAETVGRLDIASAVASAKDLDTPILTARPGLYGGLEDGGPIISA